MIRKTHHFLVLDPSSWPVISTLNIFRIFFSFLIFLKLGILINLVLRAFLLLLSRFSWWFNYRKELNMTGSMRKNIENRLKFSMILFISSEVFFFFSFFWSYFHFFLAPDLEVRFSWPFFSLKRFDPFGVPLLNTFILLSSGVTITISHYFITKKKNSHSLIFSFITVFLGLFFSFLQWIEYKNSFFSITDGSFGSSFFILTGFHGLHVIIGTVFILVNLKYFRKFSFHVRSIVSFEIAAWYWHFVDVVWIFLYFCLYYSNIYLFSLIKNVALKMLKNKGIKLSRSLWHIFLPNKC